MLRRLSLSVPGVCAFVLLAGQPAFAGGHSWWAWLDELSGPGPFKGVGGGVATLCIGPADAEPNLPGVQAVKDKDGKDVYRLQLAGASGCLDQPERRPRIHFTAGWARAKAGRGFPAVTLWTFEPSFMYPTLAIPWFSAVPDWLTRSIDVGGGAGLYAFDVDGVGLKLRPSLHGAVHWYFLQTLPGATSRFLRVVRMEWMPRALWVHLDDAALGVPDRRAQGFQPFSDDFETLGWGSVRVTFNLPLPLR